MYEVFKNIQTQLFQQEKQKYWIFLILGLQKGAKSVAPVGKVSRTYGGKSVAPVGARTSHHGTLGGKSIAATTSLLLRS